MNRRSGSTCLAALFVAGVLAGCGGGGDEGDQAAGETTTAASAEAVPLEQGDPARGKELYLNNGCGSCHTFEAAGSTRNVGPNLDEAVAMYPPEFLRESIVDPQAYIENGEAGSIGGTKPYGSRMPAYGPEESPPSNLSEQDIADIVAFLVEGAGG